MTVPVARREIHPRVRPRGIFAEDLFHQADALEEDRPLDRRQQPHRRDDVRDGQLTRGLALVLDAQHLFRRVVLGFERTLQRVPCRRRRRRLIAQPVQQLDDEGRRETAARGGLVAQHLVDDAIGLARARVQLHAPFARAVAAAARRDDVGSEPAQLFDERQAQHDRDGPDFADGQRRDPLIRGRKIDERLQVESARGVRDELAGEGVDARVADKRAVGELGQLQVVVPRKVLTDLANLVLHDVVVVPQPVFGPDRRRVLRDGRREKRVRIVELVRAGIEPGEKRPAADGSGASRYRPASVTA